jgi:hypothetical protein
MVRLLVLALAASLADSVSIIGSSSFRVATVLLQKSLGGEIVPPP